MNRRPHQTNFIDINAAPAAAANRLAADILHGQPTTLPGPDDALQNLSMYRAVHSPPETDDEDASGPVSPTSLAAAWRAAVRRASATEEAGDGPEAVDARIRREIAAESPYVPAQTCTDGLVRDVMPLRAQIGDSAPFSPAQRPAGVTDAYAATDTYRPSASIVDALGASPLERLEMEQLAVRAEYGGRAQWQTDDPTDATEAQDEFSLPPGHDRIHEREENDFDAWLSGLLPWRRQIACGFGIVAFVAVAAWLVYRAVTGGGQP